MIQEISAGVNVCGKNVRDGRDAAYRCAVGSIGDSGRRYTYENYLYGREIKDRLARQIGDIILGCKLAEVSAVHDKKRDSHTITARIGVKEVSDKTPWFGDVMDQVIRDANANGAAEKRHFEIGERLLRAEWDTFGEAIDALRKAFDAVDGGELWVEATYGRKGIKQSTEY